MNIFFCEHFREHFQKVLKFQKIQWNLIENFHAFISRYTSNTSVFRTLRRTCSSNNPRDCRSRVSTLGILDCPYEQPGCTPMEANRSLCTRESRSPVRTSNSRCVRATLPSRMCTSTTCPGWRAASCQTWTACRRASQNHHYPCSVWRFGKATRNKTASRRPELPARRTCPAESCHTRCKPSSTDWVRRTFSRRQQPSSLPCPKSECSKWVACVNCK